jgi:uncharacterized membrane protein YadS
MARRSFEKKEKERKKKKQRPLFPFFLFFFFFFFSLSLFHVLQETRDRAALLAASRSCQSRMKRENADPH